MHRLPAKNVLRGPGMSGVRGTRVIVVGEKECDGPVQGKNRDHAYGERDSQADRSLSDLGGGALNAQRHRGKKAGDSEEETHPPQVQPENREVEAGHVGARGLQVSHTVVRHQEEHDAGPNRIDVMQPRGSHEAEIYR